MLVHLSRHGKFQLYKLTSFNWNHSSMWIFRPLTCFNCTNLHPSTETKSAHGRGHKADEFQLYKLTSFNWNRNRLNNSGKLCGFNCTNLHPSTETQQIRKRIAFFSFNCTNLHPSTETSPSRPRQRTSCGFQLYKLTSFNWNSLPCNYFQLRFCFNCTNLHPSTETEATSWTLHFH